MCAGVGKRTWSNPCFFQLIFQPGTFRSTPERRLNIQRQILIQDTRQTLYRVEGDSRQKHEKETEAQEWPSGQAYGNEPHSHEGIACCHTYLSMPRQKTTACSDAVLLATPLQTGRRAYRASHRFSPDHPCTHSHAALCRDGCHEDSEGLPMLRLPV